MDGFRAVGIGVRFPSAVSVHGGLRTQHCAGDAIFKRLPPVASLGCLQQHHAWQSHVPALPQKGFLLFAWQRLRPLSAQTHFLRRIFLSPEICRVDLLGCVNLHDLLLVAVCAIASCQLASRSLLSDYTPPLPAVCDRLLDFALHQVVAGLAEVFRVQLSVLHHH